MQPHPPQLPREDAQRPVPANLKKGALWALLALVVIAALLAFMLPSKQAKNHSPLPPPAHRTQSPAFDHPTQQ